MDAELFLASACELLAIPSTSEQPGELRRALDYVVDFVGPGFTTLTVLLAIGWFRFTTRNNGLRIVFASAAPRLPRPSALAVE